jgi:signal peptidase II
MPTRTRDHRLFLFFLSIIVIVADRLTKDWVVAHILPGRAIDVIHHVFRLTHVLNTGAAFSLGDSLSPLLMRNILIGFSILAVVVVAVMLYRIGHALNATSVALALILGGAIGNLYDRLVLRHVVDFLEVHIVHYHWPDFNVADSCIVIGACLLLLEIFRPQPVQD